MEQCIEINFNRKWSRVKSFIKQSNTRQLMSWLESARAFGGNYIHGNYSMKLQDLKDELAKREHIPNKIESQELRVKKIKTRNPKGRGDK